MKETESGYARALMSFVFDELTTRGVSQSRFALDNGIAVSQMGKWASGQHTPTVAQVAKMANGLNRPVIELLAVMVGTAEVPAKVEHAVSVEEAIDADDALPDSMKGILRNLVADMRQRAQDDLS